MGGRAVGLLLVTLLIMSGNRAEDCGEEEYWHKGLCCVLCPAGTYVSQHCTTPHSKGRCVSCTEGEDYTAHANGLDECLLCRQCRDDQITLRACTPTHDTECQCKQGYFCPAEGCEICQRCSKTCPEGKEIVQNCNATMDLGCGLPDQGNTSLIWTAAIISAVVVLVVVVFIIKKLRCDKATSPDKVEKSLASESSTESLFLSEVKIANNADNPDGENSVKSPEDQEQANVNLNVTSQSPEENSVLPSGRGTILQSLRCSVQDCWKKITLDTSLSAKTGPNPAFYQSAQSKGLSARMPANCMVREQKYQITVKDLSQKELRDCFWAFINEVPVKKWRRLMRTHLKENDIDKIIYDWPNNTEEQSYQMLLIWRNTLGEKQSIIKLLDELRYLDTKAYDNVMNTLTSNNIVSKIVATD
ncbi:tumor necrosis factor receptor superfamily member 10B-like [Mergus octosetaceus]